MPPRKKAAPKKAPSKFKRAINSDFNKRPPDMYRGGKSFASSFNEQFPIGALVWYFRDLMKGPKVATSIRDSAFVTESGHVVCFVNGVSGFVLCDHILQREE